MGSKATLKHLDSYNALNYNKNDLWQKLDYTERKA